MLSLPIAVLVVEDPEKTSCLVGLIAVIGFVDDNRMRCSVFLAGNTFGLVRVDIPEVGTVIHQHIIGDDLLGKMAAYGAVSIVSIRKRIEDLGKDPAAFERFVDFGILDRESKECIPDGIKRLLGRRLKESVENRRKAAVVKNFFNIDRQERQGIPFPQCNVLQNVHSVDLIYIPVALLTF